jgi:hypothetical protein
MERRDISATAKNICWLLLVERMNSHTGKCFCSNQHIAQKLGIGITSVKRAKLELKDAGIFEPSTQAQNGPTQKSQISSFRFLRRFGDQNGPTKPQNWTEPKMGQAQNGPTQIRANRTKIPIKVDGPEADAWRQAGAHIPFSTRTGIWEVPSQWPPATVGPANEIACAPEKTRRRRGETLRSALDDFLA